MSEAKLELERFRELVAAYGGDFERWPDHERARGLALFETSPEARAVVADEEALDRALGELPEPVLSAALERRLVEIPAVAQRRRVAPRSLGLSAFGWAAAAALGLFIGTQTAAFDGGEAELGTEAPAVESELAENEGSTETWTEEDESIALALGAFAALEEEP